jgi:hypothetical protein
MAQLSELFDVNHFIVSQVNPHGVALSTLSTRVGTIGVAGLMRTGEFSRAHLAVSHRLPTDDVDACKASLACLAADA